MFRPDEELAREIMRAFTWRYGYAGGENLPVKSSATQLLSDGTPPIQTVEESVDETETYGTGATGKEAGIAYHAFLETFDFSLLYGKDGERIDTTALKELVLCVLADLEKDGNVQTELLSAEKLTEILSNPVFYTLRDMRLYKERQFLVALPVRDTYAKKSGADERLHDFDEREEILFQGAIDLMAVGDGEVRIIDYKYSVKDPAYLKEHYRPQLDLYKRAAAKILKIPLERIRCSIVNIYRGFQVDMD